MYANPKFTIQTKSTVDEFYLFLLTTEKEKNNLLLIVIVLIFIVVFNRYNWLISHDNAAHAMKHLAWIAPLLFSQSPRRESGPSEESLYE